MEENTRKPTRSDKISFGLYTTVISLFLIFFTACLIGLITSSQNPKKDELKYENVTYLRYETKKPAKSGRRYLVFVSEYDEPLEIDNIVFYGVDENSLINLTTGDVLTVSYYKYNDKYTLYTMSKGEKDILPYEVYLSQHNRNNTVGFVVVPLLFTFTTGLLIFDIVYYVKKGKPLPI